MGTVTPWGRADSSKKLARGIMLYSTPGHGGFHVSPTVNVTIHPALRKANGWYEEDCEWARVALAFPALFSAADIEQAHCSLKNYDPDAYELWYRHTKADPLYEIPLAESRKKRQREFSRIHADDYVTIAAMGDWYVKDGFKVPEGMVRVCAVRGGRTETGHYASKDEKCFLVPADEYQDRTTFGFVVDPNKYQECP